MSVLFILVDIQNILCYTKKNAARYKIMDTNKSDLSEMRCFCGHDCSKCNTYLATVNDDDSLRLASRFFYSSEFGVELDLGCIRCSGGRSDDVFILCKDCPFVKCCRERKISSCKECSDYPCERISEYEKKYVNKCNQIRRSENE